MNVSVLKKFAMTAGIVAVCFASVVPLTGYLSSIRPAMPETYDDSDLTVKGAHLKGFALGMEGLLADYYFMRTLQYIGKKILNAPSESINIEDLSNLNPRLVYPLLDTATSLDPHFIAPYSFGAMLLPAIDPDSAIALGVKGTTNNPNEWRLYQHLGYTYWRLKRYEEAAEIYQRGSQIAGSAPFMKMMAASMKTEGGSRETARAIYKQMLADAEDEQVTVTAQRQLDRLDWFDEREAIDRELAQVMETSGRCANSFGEIIPMLMRVRLPDNRDFRVNERGQLVDPSGAPYVLNKENCRVQLDGEKTKLPLS